MCHKSNLLSNLDKLKKAQIVHHDRYHTCPLLHNMKTIKLVRIIPFLLAEQPLFLLYNTYKQKIKTN